MVINTIVTMAINTSVNKIIDTIFKAINTIVKKVVINVILKIIAGFMDIMVIKITNYFIYYSYIITTTTVEEIIKVEVKFVAFIIKVKIFYHFIFIIFVSFNPQVLNDILLYLNHLTIFYLKNLNLHLLSNLLTNIFII